MAQQSDPRPTEVIDLVRAVAPGLSLSKIFGDIGSELKHLGEQGSHEMAAALFRGDAFVMYPHHGKEAEGQSQSVEATVQHGMDQPAQERGGMER